MEQQTAAAAHGPSQRSENRILAALPAAERDRLDEHLERVELEQGSVLQLPDEEIRHVYFPLQGIASLIAIGREGEEVDTAMVGNEGMVGLPVFLGTGQMPVRSIVQIDMVAYRLSAAELRAELERGGTLVKLLLRYAQMVVVQLAQLVVCNRMHALDERTARWILQINERLGGNTPFEATQEFVAAMVGSTRPHVTLVLQQFREQGLVNYRRGDMHVVDAGRLEERSCGCYRTIRTELDRLLATSERYDITAGR